MVKFFYIFILCFICFMFIFCFLTQKYNNPYKLIMVFGKKGSGKSTLLSKFAFRHMRKGWTVYSTEPIAGTYLISPSQVGYYNLVDYNFNPFNPDDYKGISRRIHCFFNRHFPKRPRILLLVDEVGMVWDNRDYKNFKIPVRDWFKYMRHHCVKCYLFSQSFDIDKKLRDLTDQMFLVRNFARVFTYGKRIKKFITIKDSNTADCSTLAEGMEFEPFFMFPFGSRTLTFIPHWSKFFNSFVTPDSSLRQLNFRESEFDYDKFPHVQVDDEQHPYKKTD